MRRRDVFVVIQSCAGREAALADTLGSLRLSDVGEPDAIVAAVSGEPIQTTFLRTIAAIASSSCRFGLRLEDDVLANKHVMANLATWPALRQPDFGLGWLFVSRAVAAMLAGAERVERYREVVMSQAVLVPNVAIDAVAASIETKWLACDGQQDRALSRAVYDFGRRVYVHYPPLFEHNLAHPSTLAPTRPNVPGVHDSGGAFEVDWRRGLL